MAEIQVTITPSDATDKSFTVESDHPEIVSVEGTTCTAKKAGQAVLTITTNDGSKTAQCTVTVREATKSVSSVSVEPTTKEVNVGDSFTVGEA
ncbi:Ig-like domain-containing protein [Escherichia fergusonii]|uniref:Ig-like domain-containing protein n=1 Tax=Escherichia fergusonii TaxID=564 RepID=UPI002433AF02|nr:Ig-like domain-containing protein [Escherichia fergusonii]WGA68560.1 Ig-like domain-containing protein [Escherichia fergusonii]